MTPQQAVATLKAMYKLPQKAVDNEADHFKADRVLCDLLRDLGHGDAVDAYDLIEKWYA